MAKLPRNEKLDQLRKEGKTRSSRMQKPGAEKVLTAPKRAKPYLQGELFKGKVRSGQAVPTGVSPGGRKWEKL